MHIKHPTQCPSAAVEVIDVTSGWLNRKEFIKMILDHRDFGFGETD